MFYGKLTPGCKYEMIETLTRPRSAAVRMYPKERVKNQVLKDSRGHTIKKDRVNPCVGMYKE